MTIPELGKLESVNVRDVWEHEAHNFTPWLAGNITQLGEALNMDLELAQQEAQVGDFSLDILATDGSGAMVAIENQLEWTDHSHLGQILTYAAGHDARILIWVTPQFRDEHRAALDWLNRWTPEEIEVYGVEVRAVKIGNSAIAAEFIPVAFPNAWSKWGSRSQGGPSERNLQFREFFQPLIDDLHSKGFTDKSRALSRSDQSFPSDAPGVTYHASLEGDGKAWVYISAREPVKSSVFRQLREVTSEIESKLQLESDIVGIEWMTRARNIGVWREGSLNDPEDKLEEIRQWMSHYLLKFKEVFNPRMEEIIRDLESADKQQGDNQC